MNLKVGLVSDNPRFEIRKNKESIKEDKQKFETTKRIREVLSERYEVVDVITDERMPLDLIEKKIDIVFNLSTGIRGESRQSQVPALLEMVGIPYVGSGVLAHSLALDKPTAKIIFKYYGISTPDFEIINEYSDNITSNLRFPLIAKPSSEGSGIGIYKESLVYNLNELKKQIKNLINKYNQPILVEEFIEGREFTVGILGNKPDIKVLPPLEINFDDVPEEYGRFNTFEVKSKYWQLAQYYCPPDISDVLRSKIEKIALDSYIALECRDFARVDIRVRDDKPYILEINTLPGLEDNYSDFPRMARAAGIEYPELINRLLDIAKKRCNI